jgi:hypothetical protein
MPFSQQVLLMFFHQLRQSGNFRRAEPTLSSRRTLTLQEAPSFARRPRAEPWLRLT